MIGRLAWRAADKDVVAAVSRDAGVLGLSGPPTITGTGRARDGRPSQLLAVDSFLVDRASVDAGVRVEVDSI